MSNWFLACLWEQRKHLPPILLTMPGIDLLELPPPAPLQPAPAAHSPGEGMVPGVVSGFLDGDPED